MRSSFQLEARRRHAPSVKALSLIETMLALAIGASLMAFVVAGLSGVVDRAKNAKCTARMKGLGSAILQYAQENNGEYPRSFHSSAGAGQQGWAREILPYLGYEENPTGTAWERIFNKAYRCPSSKTRDINIYSYAMNVHFELTPDGDDYVGSPSQWRRTVNVERPGATILLAEPKEVYYADHVMCHTWTSLRGATNAIDGTRHGKVSNYIFADGHIASSKVADQYDPARGINNFNPLLAR